MRRSSAPANARRTPGSNRIPEATLNPFPSLAALSDRELLVQVKRLVQCEREATAELVAHLAEMERRELHLGEGCSSLFIYCTQVLHLTEHAAYGRIGAARAARKFPVILEMLGRGSVNLTSVMLLAPHLSTENHRGLLAAARHRSKRHVEELVASLRPQTPVPTTVRKLPTPRHDSAPPEPPLAAPWRARGAGAGAPRPGQDTGVARPDAGVDAQPPAAHTGGLESAPPAEAPATEPALQPPVAASPLSTPAAATSIPARRTSVTPLAPECYRVQFTATAAMYEKLCRARELLRHQIPDGDPAAVLDQALSVLLQHLARTRLAATDQPRASRAPAPGSRHIPAAVKREVWKRDGGRCAFVSRDGRRCNEPGFLEFHHVHPHGDGGEPTPDNIELRCRAHNRYEADLYFGPHVGSNHHGALAPAERGAREPGGGRPAGPESDAHQPGVREWPARYSTRKRSRARERLVLGGPNRVRPAVMSPR